MKFLLMLSVMLTILGGCASKNRQDASGLRYVSAAAGWSTGSRPNAIAEANKICAANGGGITIEREGSCGFTCEIYFRCFDYNARVAAIKKEEEAKRARELQAQREQEMREEQRRRAEQAEWERTRPEREAAARAAQEKERSRLNAICPIYYLARQTCANSGGGYEQCMTIRIGKSYSSWDDRTCFNR